MQLSRADFDARYADGTLRIAFIGMSNIGKSYTAMRLATDFDFSLIEVDALIRKELGHADMDAFAAWQGQPYSDGYAAREAESIALEKTATAKALLTEARNPLLDTTGSAIYTGENVLHDLRARFHVVHIEAAEDALERLRSAYFACPKPLIWAGQYHCADGQDPHEAILESYPKLLQSRAGLYAAEADATLPSNFILNADVGAEEIFARLRPAR